MTIYTVICQHHILSPERTHNFDNQIGNYNYAESGSRLIIMWYKYILEHKKGGREGGREGGGRVRGGREGGREGGRDGGRERARERGMEGGRERGSEGGREGGRESIIALSYEPGSIEGCRVCVCI